MTRKSAGPIVKPDKIGRLPNPTVPKADYTKLAAEVFVLKARVVHLEAYVKTLEKMLQKRK